MYVVKYSMQLNKKTFCAAPWFSMRNQNTGEFKVCCEHSTESTDFVGRTKYNSNDSLESWMNSDYQQYLRQQLNNGVKVNECRKCWDREDNGLTSLRQNINNMVTDSSGGNLDQTWLPVYFKNKNNYRNDLLLMADVKINNICNFSCAMCNAADSSIIHNKWSSQQHNEFVLEYTNTNASYFADIKDAYQEKNGMQVLDEVLTGSIKFLKLLGGEPLLNPKLLLRLTEIPEKQRKKINLMFITNGSVDLVDTSRKLAGFNSIYYIISIEATGSIQDYVRRGSSWETIQKNIDQFLNYAKTSTDNLCVEVHTTIQSLNIAHYADLKTWCQDRNIKTTITMLETPAYLGLAILPDHIKQQAIENLTETNTDSDTQALIIALENTKVNPILVEKFIRFIKWYDPKLELLDIDSRWQGLFNNTMRV